MNYSLPGIFRISLDFFCTICYNCSAVNYTVLIKDERTLFK